MSVKQFLYFKRRWTFMKPKLIGLLLLNALLLLVAIYGLWGQLWVWQPGSAPPQWVPLFGANSYLQAIKNRGYDATLVYGFLTYRVDIWVNGVNQPGVTRFDWTQFSIILLIALNSWILVDFLRTRKQKHAKIPKTDLPIEKKETE